MEEVHVTETTHRSPDNLAMRRFLTVTSKIQRQIASGAALRAAYAGFPKFSSVDRLSTDWLGTTPMQKVASPI